MLVKRQIIIFGNDYKGIFTVIGYTDKLELVLSQRE